MIAFSVQSIKESSLVDFQDIVKQRLSLLLHTFKNSEQQIGAWNETARWVWEAVTSLTYKSDPIRIVFEFNPPLSTERPDVLIVGAKEVLVIEAKTGSTESLHESKRQVLRYARSIYNYVDVGRQLAIVPVLVRTGASGSTPINFEYGEPTKDTVVDIPPARLSQLFAKIEPPIDYSSTDTSNWLYNPRPSIIDAARVMFSDTSDKRILSTLADDDELTALVDACTKQIRFAKENKKKLVIAVSGVPGAGKTLVGLRLANSPEIQQLCSNDETSPPLYLSGNGPLVDVLTEALVRDERNRTQCSKTEAQERALAKIRLIHGLTEDKFAVNTHVLIFDEAQRAWDQNRMRTKSGKSDLRSEAEEVLRRFERDKDWAVIICLVGTGQQINDGERGMSTWTDAISARRIAGYKWEMYGSSVVAMADSADVEVIEDHPELHLKVVRRANDASVLGEWVGALLENKIDEAAKLREQFLDFPIFVTRNLDQAKEWLRDPTRPKFETYGLLTSSRSARLGVYGVDAQASAGSTHDWTQWFLDRPPNLNSSLNLEVAATEFKCQGLELDRTCVCWSWDLVRGPNGWVTRKLRKNDSRWLIIKNRREYAINTYRVLLTRARAGMVIWVPTGENADRSRRPDESDAIFQTLIASGCSILGAASAE